MKSRSPTHRLLTYYKFIDIPLNQCPQLVEEHRSFCSDIGLKGRIYIGTEWISATITGNPWQCRAYQLRLQSTVYFQDITDIEVKSMAVHGHQFLALRIKHRNEIVTMGQTVTATQVHRSHHTISVSALKEIIDQSDPNYLLLDMRNNYEHKLGHFQWSLPSGTTNFREVHEQIARYKKEFGNKKIVMFCTGGIRCDKLSVLLHEQWLDDVYGLDGGVVKYINTYNDGNRLWNLYTFDERVSTPVGDALTHTTIGTCIYTDALTDHITNCRYSPCNARIICKPNEYRKHGGFCSRACIEKACGDARIREVRFDPFDYQSLRDRIKSDSSQHSIITQTLQTHLAKYLRMNYRHRISQKEDEIDE